MLYDCKRIPHRIDRRLSGLAGPDYDATISIGLPLEPEDSQYGKSRPIPLRPSSRGGAKAGLVHTHAADCNLLVCPRPYPIRLLPAPIGLRLAEAPEPDAR